LQNVTGPIDLTPFNSKFEQDFLNSKFLIIRNYSNFSGKENFFFNFENWIIGTEYNRIQFLTSACFQATVFEDAHDEIKVGKSLHILMRSARPSAIVDHTSSSRGKVGSIYNRFGSLETTVDKFVKGGVEVRFGWCVSESLNIVGPVENGTKPLGLIILANSLWIWAEVDVLKLRNLWEHLTLQVAVIVGTSSLDCSTAPPTASFSHCSGSAFHWTRSPAGEGLSSHAHWLVDGAGPRLLIEWCIQTSIGSLCARCSFWTSVVVLITSRPGCITTWFPHCLSEKSSDVGKTLFATFVWFVFTQEKLSFTWQVIELTHGCAETFPCVNWV
jgi:hypothetical protein